MIDQPNSPDPHVDLTGRTLGDYAILRRLGKGGMADVYLARQQSLQRNVALKVLKPELAKDHSYIERFKREAQSAARLVQANIVGVYEVGELEGFHYIAQEYVVGRNLREHLARNGAVKPVMAINVIRQVALALQKASEHNVTHRDIKPENIMLSPGGEVKVADFGLARVEDENNKHLTQIGITMGTPLYMSPEQVEGTSVDVRSDIYSLGVSAYHMLAGYPPFDGENALSIAIQHVKNEPEPLGQIRPDVPTELIQLIEKMMAKSPENRPQDAGQLLKSVKTIKVDAEQDWDQLVETLAIENASTKTTLNRTQTKIAATRQLQSIMKGNVKSWWTELSTILGFFVLLFTGLFVGLWFANQYPVVDPLDSPYLAPGAIRKLESSRQQYEFTVNFHSSELEYYQAVIDYFPLDESSDSFYQDRLYHYRAKERQAEIFLNNEDFDNAERIYTEFAESDDDDSRISIVGRAGLAIVLHHQNATEAAQNEIIGVESEVNGVLNDFLMNKFNDIRRHYFETNTISIPVDTGESAPE